MSRHSTFNRRVLFNGELQKYAEKRSKNSTATLPPLSLNNIFLFLLIFSSFKNSVARSSLSTKFKIQLFIQYIGSHYDLYKSL